MSTTKRSPRPKPPITAPDPRAILARRLDLLADLELQQGHYLAAEMLANRAVELRESRA